MFFGGKDERVRDSFQKAADDFFRLALSLVFSSFVYYFTKLIVTVLKKFFRERGWAGNLRFHLKRQTSSGVTASGKELKL